MTSNRSGFGNFFYGADAPLAVLPNGGILEPYEFVRTSRNLRTEAGAPGDLTSSTSGVRSAGKLSARTDYNVEAAIQRGSLGSDTISAWAGHALIGRTIPIGRRPIGRSANTTMRLATKHPADGVRGTFDQLYPTAHDKYGLADQVGWKNIHHLRTGLEVRPHAKLALAGGYHSFWLASATDALYNAGGAVHRAHPDRRAGSPRRAGARHPGDLHAIAAHPAARRLRAHLHRRVSQGSHTGQVLQRSLT